ncbi:MAG: hypothetical protein AB7V61_06845, partial [Methylocystis sp.]
DLVLLPDLRFQSRQDAKFYHCDLPGGYKFRAVSLHFLGIFHDGTILESRSHHGTNSLAILDKAYTDGGRRRQ